MKAKFLVSIIMAFTTSCALHNSTMLPSIEEQCKVLSKKQNNVSSKPKKIKKQNAKKTHSILVTQEKQASQSTELSELFLQTIDPKSLYALNADKLTLYPNPNQKNQTQILPSKGIAQSEALNIENGTKSINELQTSEKSDFISLVDNQISRTTDNTIPLLLGVSGLFSLFLLKRGQRKAGEFSYWAAKNPWKARAILTSAHLATGISAITLGNHLLNEGVYFSDTSNYLSMAAFSTSALLYSSTNSFIQRKIHDTILFTTGTIMLISVGNQYTFTNQDNSYLAIPSHRFTTNYSYIENSSEKIAPVKDEPSKKSTGAKIGLTVLAVVLFAVLAYGLAALSCSIACSGNEGMAAIVGIGGGIGLIALLVISLKAIYRKAPNKKKQKIATEKSSA
jgi:hypothetical protein